MEGSVSVLAVATTMEMRQEFTMLNELQTIGIQGISPEFQPLYQAENAHAKNHLVEKTIVSVLEQECLVDRNVSVWIAVTVNLTVMTQGWEDLAWR